MNSFFWSRTNPSVVAGVGPFGTDQQRALLEQALACSGAGVGLQVPPNDPAVAVAGGSNGIAIGDGAQLCCGYLRGAIAHNIARSSKNPACRSQISGPLLNSLVLVIPKLGADYFCIKDKPYSEAALVLEAVGRVVVLCCGRDSVVMQNGGKPTLGQVGSVAGTDPRVHVIDISSLIEHHSDAAYGVLCSCESVGLIRRLLAGVAVDAALVGRAKILSNGQ